MRPDACLILCLILCLSACAGGIAHPPAQTLETTPETPETTPETPETTPETTPGTIPAAAPLPDPGAPVRGRAGPPWTAETLQATEQVWEAVNGPEAATGQFAWLRVVDPRGRPIAGAAVRIDPIRSGMQAGGPPDHLSGADGAIAVPASPVLAVTGIEVTAPGWSLWSMSAPIPARIVLRRELDAVLSDLAREADPAERLWLMLELTGPRPPEWDRVRLFQVTGDLLPELRALVDSGRFIRTDADRDSPAARARALLAWWNDPQDAGRIGPPDADRRATPALTAADPSQLCSAFTEHHFNAEGFKDPAARTWHACITPDLSRDGSRAVISFEVRYAHWGYQIQLSAVREPGAPEAARWRLYDARMSGREHFL